MILSPQCFIDWPDMLGISFLSFCRSHVRRRRLYLSI